MAVYLTLARFGGGVTAVAAITDTGEDNANTGGNLNYELEQRRS